MAGRFGRYIVPIAIVVLLAAVAWQRAYWAQVSQWREDQACNLWLGFTQPLSSLPVGLISSVGTPNPNGMPLLAELLSKLPNLWAVSSVLGLVQGALLICVCGVLFGPNWRFLIVVGPLLSSVLLTATSVEFWNNWILTSFDLAFFACYMGYSQEGIQKRSPRDARYIVTYAADPAPEPKQQPRSITHHKLGRLRVTILERYPSTASR